MLVLDRIRIWAQRKEITSHPTFEHAGSGTVSNFDARPDPKLFKTFVLYKIWARNQTYLKNRILQPGCPVFEKAVFLLIASSGFIFVLDFGAKLNPNLVLTWIRRRSGSRTENKIWCQTGSGPLLLHPLSGPPAALQGPGDR